MKKVASLALGMMLAFGLVGCDKKVEEKAPVAETVAPAQEAPAATTEEAPATEAATTEAPATEAPAQEAPATEAAKN